VVIAMFNSTTAWVGETITYDDAIFSLEGHRVISAADVLVAYDGKGHIAWACEGLKEWVEQRAASSGGASHAAARVWAVGKGGTILFTTDGGTMWSVLSLEFGADLNAICLHDFTRAWAAGEGVILDSADGGATWGVVPVICESLAGVPLKGIALATPPTAGRWATTRRDPRHGGRRRNPEHTTVGHHRRSQRRRRRGQALNDVASGRQDVSSRETLHLIMCAPDGAANRRSRESRRRRRTERTSPLDVDAWSRRRLPPGRLELRTWTRTESDLT